MHNRLKEINLETKSTQKWQKQSYPWFCFYGQMQTHDKQAGSDDCCTTLPEPYVHIIVHSIRNEKYDDWLVKCIQHIQPKAKILKNRILKK